MSEGLGGVQIFCFFFLKKENRGGFYFLVLFLKEHCNKNQIEEHLYMIIPIIFKYGKPSFGQSKK
jgi:hypothetical protein